MQIKSYSDLYKLVVALAGVGTFTTEEKVNIEQFVNRRAFEAYSASPSWPRYAVIGEERAISSAQLRIGIRILRGLKWRSRIKPYC